MEKDMNPSPFFGHDAKEYGILSLAYLGDAVMEIMTREYLLKYGSFKKPGDITNAAKAFVTCEAQSDAFGRIESLLTAEEADVFRRGRNAKTHFAPKHGDLIQYKRATGFESLMGYLYSSGECRRAKELFLAAFGPVLNPLQRTE
ncbi:MAG: ribonuclease III [Clostridiales bacterium]|nr:ribonuclease III [Clostridiales bacterium]